MTEALANRDLPPPAEIDHRTAGVIYGVLAYGWWGTVMPMIFWWLRELPAEEILAHRITWGFPFIAILLTVRGRWSELAGVLTAPRRHAVLLATTVLIAINWFGFTFAVVTGRALEASLGYYINPLVNVALGMIFLHERLRRAQWLALALAAGAVAYLTLSYGRLPWIALMLGFSFGFYGLLRKRAHVESMAGLTVEMGLLLPFTTAFVVFNAMNGEPTLPASTTALNAILLATGIATVFPLLWFTHAARRLRLSTMGFLQYIAPTGQFLLAVLVFGESFTTARAITFALIWTALTIYSIDSLGAHRRQRTTG